MHKRYLEVGVYYLFALRSMEPVHAWFLCSFAEIVEKKYRNNLDFPDEEKMVEIAYELALKFNNPTI